MAWLKDLFSGGGVNSSAVGNLRAAARQGLLRFEEALAREHLGCPKCGHDFPAAQGFQPSGPGQFVCPKCNAVVSKIIP